MSTLDELLERVTNKALCDAQRRSDEGMPMYAEVFYSVTQKKRTREHWSIVRGAFCQSQVCWKGREVGAPSDLYFDHPGEKRAGNLVGTLLSERSSQASVWRSPQICQSAASWSDPDSAPKVAVGSVLCEQGEYVDEAGNPARLEHNVLVSNTFALHPLFGPGHVLRTDGRVAAFWNGEMCRVVQLGNLVMLRVQIGRAEASQGRKAAKKSEAKVALAMDFLRQQIGL